MKLSCKKTDRSKQVLQIVQWGNGSPTIEKRNYFKKDGEWQCGKTAGLTLEDFKKLLANKAEVKEALSKKIEIDDNEDDEDEKPKKKKKAKKHHDDDED